MRIGELAAAAGVNVQTVRYYERRGLLPDPPRSLGGFRDYDDRALDQLRLIRSVQRLGFTLAETTELLATGRRQHATADLQAQARAKLAEVDERMADLQHMRAGLLRVIEAECESLTRCSCPGDCPVAFVDPGILASSSGQSSST